MGDSLATDLAMLVPSRGRPESVQVLADAWRDTEAVGSASLIWVIDQDDAAWSDYTASIAKFPWMRVAAISNWMPMVQKLNRAALYLAPYYTHLGFMGDDHIPRTTGWAVRLAAEIGMGPRIVYGRDGFKDEKLPTWWAMSSSIVLALGRMVPAQVQHLYCDNAIKVLGEGADCLRYVPDVLIEHMHPVAGKSAWTEGHIRVNRTEQYERDGAAYSAWVADGLDRDATILRGLRGV